MNNIFNIFPKKIYNMNGLIFLSSLNRKSISTGFFISLNVFNKYFFFLKKVFIKTFCIIHITKYMEIKIIIINISYKRILIYPKDKIGTINFVVKTNINWKPSFILNDSKRGTKCFGSTGI
ncbi:dUTP diphosphatase [Blattabacterium cuenoti]|uniref:dUTP diphosphatase n=1 Tax=Blattabacterium cuenoti TaxID=1653831 RepID=UPI00163D31FD|nr:dUTP diphosphatase [Blattabacterium cuenoti]